MLLLCLRILSVDEAISYIDFGTIGVLVGMMLFVAVVRNSGLFEYMAIKSAKIAKGSPWKIMLLFMILTAVLSAFLDNVTTVLLVGPIPRCKRQPGKLTVKIKTWCFHPQDRVKRWLFCFRWCRL